MVAARELKESPVLYLQVREKHDEEEAHFSCEAAEATAAKVDALTAYLPPSGASRAA
jgi:hypothetical protein